jgi:hypothetical protein
LSSLEYHTVKYYWIYNVMPLIILNMLSGIPTTTYKNNLPSTSNNM